MKRRQILRSVGVSGTGLTTIGLAGADKADKSLAQEDSSGSEIIDYRNLKNSEVKGLKHKIKADVDVRQLINKVDDLGWSPDWSSIRGIRYTADIGSVKGQYDVAAIKFEKRSEEQSRNNTPDEKSLDDEEMILRWTGNSTVENRKKFRTHADSATSVQKSINESAVGTSIIHIKKKSGSDLDYGITGPIADELTAYVVSDEINESRTFQRETVEIDDNEISSITAKVHPDKGPKEPGTNREIAPCCGGGGGDTYCEGVWVKVVEGHEGCYDLICLALTAGGAIGTGLSCIATAGIGCVLGMGVTSTSLIDCYHCDTIDELTVDVHTWWLEERLSNYENINPDDPCEYYTEDWREDHGIPVTKCELEDMPTKEDFNHSGC